MIDMSRFPIVEYVVKQTLAVVPTPQTAFFAVVRRMQDGREFMDANTMATDAETAEHLFGQVALALPTTVALAPAVRVARFELREAETVRVIEAAGSLAPPSPQTGSQS